MYFLVKHVDVVYILDPVKLHIFNDKESGHYVYDLLDYNK